MKFIDQFKKTCTESLNYKPKPDVLLVHPSMTKVIQKIIKGGDNMTTEEGIKSCPFCGEEDTESIEMEHDKFIKCYIKCNNCESTGPMMNSHIDAKKEWNDRPISQLIGLISPKLDSVRESISEIETVLIEIDSALEEDE